MRGVRQYIPVRPLRSYALEGAYKLLGIASGAGLNLRLTDADTGTEVAASGLYEGSVQMSFKVPGENIRAASVAVVSPYARYHSRRRLHPSYRGLSGGSTVILASRLNFTMNAVTVLLCFRDPQPLGSGALDGSRLPMRIVRPRSRMGRRLLAPGVSTSLLP